jgi:hypothetical protein
MWWEEVSWNKTEAFFSLHVYTRIRCQIYDCLKGTMHDIVVSIIVCNYFFWDYWAKFKVDIFWKTCDFWKRFWLLDKTECYRILWKLKQLQAPGGCVKLMIYGYMLTLKEEASTEEFYLIQSLFWRNFLWKVWFRFTFQVFDGVQNSKYWCQWSKVVE